MNTQSLRTAAAALIRSTLAAAALLATGLGAAQADDLPYTHPGRYNATTYSFQATANGDVMAYIVGGSGASFTNQLGLLINGKLSSAGYGLDNHKSKVGDAFDLGSVKAGDSLTFVLHNLTLHADVYSDPLMNVSFDNAAAPGHNHIYSTAYTGTTPKFAGVPVGTYVAFEDQRLPNSDYNYNDLSFVFTNVSLASPTALAVPEPNSQAMLLAGLAAIAVVARRRKL